MIFSIRKHKFIDDLFAEGTEDNNEQEDAGGNDNAEEDTSGEENDSENDNNDSNNDDMDLPEDNDEEGESNGEEDDGMGDMGDEDGEGGEDDMGSGDDIGDSTEPDPNDKIRQSEEELFNNLTQNEIQMKKAELKNNFLVLYESIDKLIERINDIKKSQNSLAIAEYSANVIAEMKSLIYTYISNSFDKKSYTESSIMFNQCLVVLRGIDDLLGTIINYELKDKLKKKNNKNT